LAPVDPILYAVDGFGQSAPELGALLAKRRRHPEPEQREKPEEAQHDHRRADSTRNSEPLQAIHASRHREAE
jgi:hypothetical protein